MDKDEIQALRDLVHEYHSNCQHSKNNLTAQLTMHSEKLGRLQEMNEVTSKNVEKLDGKLSTNFHEISLVMTKVQVTLAENALNHKNNSYLIRWMMGICTSVFVATALSILIKR